MFQPATAVVIEHVHDPSTLDALINFVTSFAQQASHHLRIAGLVLLAARPMLLMYLHLLISALIPIYTGAHASISRPSSAAKPEKKQGEDDEDQEEVVQPMEGLSAKDAIIFPLSAALVLAGLYWAIKLYGAGIINTILGWYFAGVGAFSCTKLVNDALTVGMSFIMPTYYRSNGYVWKLDQNTKTAKVVKDGKVTRSSPLGGIFGSLPLPTFLSNQLWQVRGIVHDKFTVKGFFEDTFDFDVVLTQLSAISVCIGTGAVLYSTLVDRPWWLTNIQGFAVCYGALQLMSPTTFGTGSLVLSGLFAYDIWAVFFTPLMVTVAQNLDVPIKMVFPRPDMPGKLPGDPPIKGFSMLGLGDIVLPGIMIALALRFDVYLFYLRKQKHVTKEDGSQEIESAPYVVATGYWGDKLAVKGAPASSLPAHLTTSLPKPYFTASMIGYVIGMLATLVAMSISLHPQPALLYLVPGVLISLWGTAFVRGEFAVMKQFTEADTAEPRVSEPVKAEDEKKVNVDESILAWVQGLFGEIGEIGVLFKSDTTTTASSEPKQSSADNGDAKKADTNPENIFSLTIKRYAPSTMAQKVTDSKHSLTDSGSDDAILVSHDDAETPEKLPKQRKGAPRYRHISEGSS